MLGWISSTWNSINLNLILEQTLISFSKIISPSHFLRHILGRCFHHKSFCYLHQDSVIISYKRKSVNSQLCFSFWCSTCDSSEVIESVIFWKWHILKMYHNFQRHFNLDQRSQLALSSRMLYIYNNQGKERLKHKWHICPFYAMKIMIIALFCMSTPNMAFLSTLAWENFNGKYTLKWTQ